MGAAARPARKCPQWQRHQGCWSFEGAEAEGIKPRRGRGGGAAGPAGKGVDAGALTWSLGLSRVYM